MKPSEKELARRRKDYFELVEKLKEKGLSEEAIEEAKEELINFFKELDKENERREKQEAERRMRGDAEPLRRIDRDTGESEGRRRREDNLGNGDKHKNPDRNDGQPACPDGGAAKNEGENQI